MAKKVLLVVVVALVALSGFIASRPSEFKVERSVVVSASPDVVHAQVADLHKWAAWSPWEGLDPAQKVSFSGPEQGVGQKYSWAGNDEVGSGSMTIKALKPAELVSIDLAFIEPFAANNVVDVTFVPEGANTKVVWVMSGHNNFMSKAMGVVMSMDEMVGKDFEKGLSQLKTVAEAEAKKVAEAKAAEAAAAAAAAAQPAATDGTMVAAPAAP